jgi:phage transcriptional regulator, rinA family
LINYNYIRNKNIRIKRLDKIKSDLSFLQRQDKLAKEIRDEIKELRSSMIDANSGLSNTDPVQGGGSSQEDKYFDVFDKIIELERLLKRIDLDTRALKRVLSTLDDEDRKLVDALWIEKTSSLRKLGPEVNMAKDTVKRKSDKALLYIFEELYIKTPDDVYPQ